MLEFDRAGWGGAFRVTALQRQGQQDEEFKFHLSYSLGIGRPNNQTTPLTTHLLFPTTSSTSTVMKVLYFFKGKYPGNATLNN